MSTEPAEASPYEAVLGDAIRGLHPRLIAYFAAIPAGHHGRGHGTFLRVGTPKRWLWPVYWLLQRQGVLFPGWRHDVPFTVTNMPGRDAKGRVVLWAIRRFEFAGRTREMVDAITVLKSATGPVLVDFLGRDALIECALEAVVSDGSLRMRSTAVAVRIAGIRLVIPRVFAPRVSLVERFDDGANLQHVSVELCAPVLGRLYEYAGSFAYEIRAGSGDQWPR